MRRLHRPRSLGSLFAFLLLIPLVLSSLAAPPRLGADDLADAYARQKQLEQQIAAQKAAFTDLQAAQQRAAAAIAATDRALMQVNADLTAVRAQIDKATAELDVTTRRYEDLVNSVLLLELQLARLEDMQERKQAELAARQALLAKRLQAAYQTAQTSLLEQLLTAGSLTDVIVDVSYFVSIGEQDRQLAQQIVEDKEALATIEQTVEKTRDATVAARDEAQAAKTALEQQRAQLLAAQQQLAKLKKETEALKARQLAAYRTIGADAAKAAAILKQQQVAQAAVKAEIDRLIREQYARGNIPSEYNGTLQWPLTGIVTQEFGCTGFPWEPPYGGCAHFHTGIDIAGDIYTPIRAAGAGVVVFAGPNPYDPYPKAWIVVIAHSQRLNTWYGHVDNVTHPPAVQVGDVVTAGQVIAYIGMTGQTTGPHLHWAVELDGSFANPRLFV